jgi:uncharacterized protein
MLKIDVFSHVLPQRYFQSHGRDRAGHEGHGQGVRNIPVLVDMDERPRMIKQVGDGYVQVLSMSSPPIERIGGPVEAREVARIVNEERADLVATTTASSGSSRRCR